MATTNFTPGTVVTSDWLNLVNALLYPEASATPVDNGNLVLELTNNTSLTIKVKGSDGTVRSVVLTLA